MHCDVDTNRDLIQGWDMKDNFKNSNNYINIFEQLMMCIF